MQGMGKTIMLLTLILESKHRAAQEGNRRGPRSTLVVRPSLRSMSQLGIGVRSFRETALLLGSDSPTNLAVRNMKRCLEIIHGPETQAMTRTLTATPILTLTL